VLATSAKTTVLLVEDDFQLRSIYRAALMQAGYTVLGVEDGVDALRRIEDVRPTAVVLDLALPRLGGREVQKELKARADTAHIPIVVVTGTDTSDLNPRDFDCVLRKPISPEKLVEAVEACLRKARRR
jgi:DNA-binding response OmpR family regulator